jgi:enamine deaminase RidA (YjgF/YER057c/UK114 family)
MKYLHPIHTRSAIKPHGHYVQAIEHGGTIYVSGLLGNASDAGDGRDIEAQAERSRVVARPCAETGGVCG